jgi:hypothetical protein
LNHSEFQIFLFTESLADSFLESIAQELTEVDSKRAAGAREYATDKGYAVLAAMDEISAAHNGAPFLQSHLPGFVLNHQSVFQLHPHAQCRS